MVAIYLDKIAKFCQIGLGGNIYHTLNLEVLTMLCNWEPHEEYQKRLLLNLILFSETEKSMVVSMDKPLSKLYLFNLGNLLPVIKHLYSDTGRPSENQQGIVRSLILMLDSDKHSITNWAPKIACDRLLCAACGFEFGKAPSFTHFSLLLLHNSLIFKVQCLNGLKSIGYSSDNAITS